MGRRSTRQEIVLSDADRARLERITRNPRSLRKHVWRARVVPEPGSGCGPAGTMRRTGASKPTVRHRRDRFLALGVDGLLRDATRPPGKKPTPDGPGDVAAPTACPAPDGAGAGGEAGDGLHGILKENGLGPHRVGTFRVSRDVVGLCIDPPDHAVVLAADAETPARDAGPCRDKDARLQAARPACSRPATSPPLAGVPRLPRPCRRGDRTRNPGACHPRHRLVARGGRGPHVAEGPARPDVPLHPDPGVPDGRRRGVLPEAVRTEAEGCGLRLARRMHHGDRGMHRAPRPSVPLEPEDLVEACKGGHRKLREMAPDA